MVNLSYFAVRSAFAVDSGATIRRRGADRSLSLLRGQCRCDLMTYLPIGKKDCIYDFIARNIFQLKERIAPSDSRERHNERCSNDYPAAARDAHACASTGLGGFDRQDRPVAADGSFRTCRQRKNDRHALLG